MERQGRGYNLWSCFKYDECNVEKVLEIKLN